jgi:hypothetical protein
VLRFAPVSNPPWVNRPSCLAKRADCLIILRLFFPFAAPPSVLGLPFSEHCIQICRVSVFALEWETSFRG